MKKGELERTLQGLAPLPAPRPDIEQYPTPAGIAAEVVYIAAGKGDIADRTILDAGCGNGVLALAAALCGAARVTAVDVDPDAVEVARKNGRALGVEVDWRVGDIRDVADRFDTILMNPPFGSQRRHADLPFLDRALVLGRVVYSFHNAKTVRFIVRRIAARGATITDRVDYAFPIGRMFSFHRDRGRRVPVILVRVEAAKG